MKNICELVEEMMMINDKMREEENDKKWEEMEEKVNNMIEKMWKNYEYDEVVKELEKYEISHWDFMDYIWKCREIYK